MALKFAIDNMGTAVPPRSQVGRLSAELDEGIKVTLSDGEQVSWNPPAANPVIPDISGIKAIAHYFNRTGGSMYPAYLYHPTLDPIIVKDAEEAAAVGVGYRETTEEERQRFGKKATWDWNDDTAWRPVKWPEKIRKYDPSKPETGKNFVPPYQSHEQTQRNLADDLIPKVAAAVAGALQGQGGLSKPAAIDDEQWQEFLAFQAWKKTKEAVADMAQAERTKEPEESFVINEGDDPTMDVIAWQKEAEHLGVRIDKRWGLARLKAEVAKAQEAA